MNNNMCVMKCIISIIINEKCSDMKIIMKCN